MTNPQQQALMNILKARKPNEYRAIAEMMKNGGNPLAMIQGMYQSGRITDKQLDSLKDTAKGFFNIDISEEEINAIRKSKAMPKSNKDRWF